MRHNLTITGYPSGIYSIDTKDQYFLNEPLPDFGSLFDDIGRGAHFDMPVADVVLLNSVPHINPVTQSTKAGEKSSTTPTYNHLIA